MIRRSFLQMLAGLPLLGWFKPSSADEPINTVVGKLCKVTFEVDSVQDISLMFNSPYQRFVQFPVEGILTFNYELAEYKYSIFNPTPKVIQEIQTLVQYHQEEMAKLARDLVGQISDDINDLIYLTVNNRKFTLQSITYCAYEKLSDSSTT